MKDWVKVRGSQETEPVEFDSMSSAAVVYQRRNVHRVTVEGADGATEEMWEYEERRMTHQEYSALQMEKIAAIEDALCEFDAEEA